MGYIHLGSWEPLAFDLSRSFQLLFMVIIGGLGSIIGSFFGAAFIVLVPVALSNIPHMLGLLLSVDTAAHVEHMVFGGADRVLPHRRAARAGAAVEHRQGETAHLAFPTRGGIRDIAGIALRLY